MNVNNTFKSCFLLLLFLISCQKVEKPKPPENLISKQNMVLILADAYYTNASRNVSLRKSKEKSVPLDSMLYKKHNIDSLQFVENHSYYTSLLPEYKDILEKVQVKLRQKQTKTDSVITILEYERELALCDSLFVDTIKVEYKKVEKPVQGISESISSLKNQDSLKKALQTRSAVFSKDVKLKDN